MTEAQIKIGVGVIYWGVIKDDGQRFYPLKTEIISEPWSLGHGEVVCKVKDISGGVSIRHLDLITTGSLMAAKLKGLKEITEQDIKDSTEHFFKVKGVDIKF